ncbi:MAG: SDR family oxidoreductase [Rhizobiales bacterium]|nr:SDR family oxidoreductase [Hyphomicrobiales bacterium]
MVQQFPTYDFRGKVALVTGAARGIGKACALTLAQSGADVALGLLDMRRSGDLVAEIERLGRRALPLQMDVRDVAQIRAAIAEIDRKFGRLDICVNNAGLGPENPAELVTEEDFDLTIDVNIKGTFFASQAAAKMMIKRGQGVIINLSSQAGSNVLVNESIYCTSKAAIDHMTRCLAKEWARHGIRVNAIAPTFILTDATRPALSDAKIFGHIVGHIPLGRIGEPEEIAQSVLFLASPAASLITGTVLMVDGGWSVH